MSQNWQDRTLELLKCPKCECEFRIRQHQAAKDTACPNCSWDGSMDYPNG